LYTDQFSLNLADLLDNGVGLTHLSSDTLRESRVKLLENGKAIGSAIEVVQIYDIGDIDIDKTTLMIERINEVLDELKYTKTNQLAPLCTEGGQCKPSTQPL
jgi:hypothetical protein